MLFVSFLLMTVFSPLVNLISKLKVHRTLSIAIAYVLVIGIFGGIVALIAPVLVKETTNFVNAIPAYLSQYGLSGYVNTNLMSGLVQQIGGVLSFTFSVFSNVFSVITILVFTFYMLIGYPDLEKQVSVLLGEERGKKISKLVMAVEKRLGRWSRGQMILMLTVAVGNYIGYLLLNIPYALPLAMITGIFELIPTLGPIISAIPAVLIGFGISPLTGVGAAIVALLVNQLENYVLVPKIMQKSVGVSPLVVLLSIAIGAKLAGVMGAIVAIPLVVTLQVVLNEYWGRDADHNIVSAKHKSSL